MKLTKKIVWGAAALTLSSPAFAHHSDDSSNIIGNILHWLATPPHNVIALASAAVVAFTAYKLVKNKRA